MTQRHGKDFKYDWNDLPEPSCIKDSDMDCIVYGVMGVILSFLVLLMFIAVHQ